ncbi:MAG: ATP-binding protein [Thermodesulfobacteriota bacterium]
MKNVGLRLDLAPAVPPIEADPGQLSQVIINLILNARDALGGEGEITISTSDGGGEVTVTVSDNGPGIGPDIRDKIFDPFFTTKDPGHGTGLGLSVSARIVEAFGGRIEVISEPGNGAAFSLVFPAAGDNESTESSGN